MADGHRLHWIAAAMGLIALALPQQAAAIELLPGDLVLTRQGADVLHIADATGLLSSFDTPGLVSRAGLVLDAGGGIVFVAVTTDPDSPSVVVARLDPLSGAVTVISSDGMLDITAYDIAIATDGQLYVAVGQSGIVEIDPTTGVQSLVALPPAIPAPLAIATDETDRMWVASFAPEPSGLELAEVDRVSGIALATFAIPECAEPQNGRLLAARNGEVFVNCSGTATVPDTALEARVLRVDGSSGATSILTSGELLEDPYGLAVDGNGDLLVAGSGRVVRVNSSLGSQTLVRDVEATGVAVVRAACDDGFDNDGDGYTDFPADAECTAALDLGEAENPCGDLVDNDSDGLTDFPADAGCRDVRTTTENPSCDDGVDNDLDGDIDLADASCGSAADRLERPMAPGDVIVVDRTVRALVRVDPVTGLQESLGEIGALEAPTGLLIAA